MQIDSPTRQQALTALRARSAEHISRGDMRAAENVQRDMVAINGAKGENLYDMHRLAMPATQISYPEEESLREHLTWSPAYGVVGGLAALGGTVSLGLAAFGGGGPVAVGIGVGLLGAVGGYTLWVKSRIDARNEADAVVGAVERNQAYIRGYTPPPDDPGLRLDRKVFLAALQGQEARLASGGDYTRAGEMRKVHEGLAKIPGNDVEELFQNLITGQNREVLDLVQGKCSADIAQAIETLAEVSKLVGPENQSLLREDQDALVIGGVVLKKKAA